jgi:hypothetical protein
MNGLKVSVPTAGVPGLAQSMRATSGLEELATRRQTTGAILGVVSETFNLRLFLSH